MKKFSNEEIVGGFEFDVQPAFITVRNRVTKDYFIMNRTDIKLLRKALHLFAKQEKSD